MDLIKRYMFSIHPEGLPFIGISIVITLLLLFFSDILGIIGIIITLWMVFFFRDPERISPNNDDFIISPADGVVELIQEVTPPPELELEDNRPRVRVSIFLDIFNVHVNRIPMTGIITKHSYNPGLFLSANLDKASQDNERNSFVVKNDKDQEVIFVQIAGLVARRIVWYIEEGSQVKLGEKYGIIRFGSRLDIYLPPGVEPVVGLGQKMIAGESILAKLNGEQEKFEFKKL